MKGGSFQRQGNLKEVLRFLPPFKLFETIWPNCCKVVNKNLSQQLLTVSNYRQGCKSKIHVVINLT